MLMISISNKNLLTRRNLSLWKI